MLRRRKILIRVFIYFQEGHQDLATSQHLDTLLFLYFHILRPISRRWLQDLEMSQDTGFCLHLYVGHQDLETAQHIDMLLNQSIKFC